LDLQKYGFAPEMMPKDSQGIPARVIAVHKERFALVCDYGEIYGRLKTKVYFDGSELFPTTGDFVLIQYNPCGDSIIIRTLPRKTFFSRRDPTPGRGEQAVAANVDYVFIMQSLNQDFNGKRLERYLALGWQSGATPVVVLTKADLKEDCGSYVQQAEALAVGVAVHAVSAKSGRGLAALEAYVKPGKTVVFLGSSGVGKSSLVNALAGETVMAVKEIREADDKGRHTTTHRQLIMLKNGAMVIDTPGMRELGMWDADEGLHSAFGDVEQFLGKCRFSDCRHLTEPGCAIREAIECGELSPERWENYSKLKREAKFCDNKAAYLERKRKKFMDIAKANRKDSKHRKDWQIEEQ